MNRLRIDEVQKRLPELVDGLARGDVLITRDDQPVARLTAVNGQPSLRDHHPASVGSILKPLSAEDDLLEEMLDE